MRQKFTFEIDSAKGILILTEAGEMDLGSFVKLYQETYDLEEMKEAATTGQATFIELMRRRNLFPPDDLAVKLFKAAEALFQDESTEKTVLEYEDIEAFPLEDDERISLGDDDEEEEEEVVEITDLLKEDSEDLSEDAIKEIDSDDDTPKFMPDNDSEHEN